MATENKNLADITNKVNSLRSRIINEVSKAINEYLSKGGKLDNYKIVWNQLQDIASDRIKSILQSEFRRATIEIPDSKSTYPDIKFIYSDVVIAVDIKSNESGKQPWFDIARLDTIVKERIDKYDEEYELLIKYDRETGRLIKLYFEYLRHIVGFNDRSKGVKYRPYDGKLRPKSWEDFDNNVVFWKTKADFLKGIRKSQIYRWKILIKETLLKILGEKEKKEFKKLFE